MWSIVVVVTSDVVDVVAVDEVVDVLDEVGTVLVPVVVEVIPPWKIRIVVKSKLYFSFA